MIKVRLAVETIRLYSEMSKCMQRHITIDTGFKQIEHAIFSTLFLWDKNWNCF